MDTIGIAYLVVFLIGFVFLVISFLFGSFSADGDVGHVDGVDLGHADASPGVFSIKVMACFLVGFGAAALVSHYWVTAVMPGLSKFPIDMTFGLAGGAGVGWVGWKIIGFFLSQQGFADVRSADFVGTVATLTLGIQEGGTGEISFIHKGQRISLDVREENGQPLAVGTKVIVVSMAGSVGIVHKA